MAVFVKMFGIASGVVSFTADVTSVRELRRRLHNYCPDAAGNAMRFKAFVNGRAVHNCKLTNGDEVILLTPSAGG